jgi:hypothetical protein
MHLNKVVLVGSSRILLEQKLGSVIDTFDHVIRFNAYQIRGFEEHVGSKEEIWAANIGLCTHRDTIIKKIVIGGVKYIWYVGNSYSIERQFLDIKKNKERQFVVESINFNVADLIDSIKQDFVEENLCFEKNKIRVGPEKKYATTGLRAIFKAIEKYGTVFICGFTCWRECVGQLKNSHYYGISSVPSHMHVAFTEHPDREHDVKTEEKIINKLIEMKYLIRLEDM